MEYFQRGLSIERVDAEHHNTKRVRVETLQWVSKTVMNEPMLYVHMLKELSKGKMGVDLIQYVLDAFGEDEEK